MLVLGGPPGVRPLTLGLEFEFVMFGERADIKRAINRLRHLKPPIDVSAVGEWDGVRDGAERWTVWLVKNDTSIATLNMSRNGIPARAVELVSSILKDNGVEAVGGWREIVVAVVLAIGTEGIEIFVSEHTKTGLHVHIGVGVDCEFTLDEVKKVCMLYIIYEFDIDRYHASHRSVKWSTEDPEEAQCKSNKDNALFGDQRTAIVLERIRRCPTLEGLTCMMCPSQLSADGQTAISAEREYKLNLLSLERHRTLEWRQHEGTTDPFVACGWAGFVLHFVRRALSLSFDEIEEHSEKSTPLVPDLVPDGLCPRRDTEP